MADESTSINRGSLQDNPLFRLVILVLCVLTGLSALALLGSSLVASPRVWFMAGFEVVIVAAAVVGCLTAMGKFREGPALALACVAGTIGVGSLLAYVGPAKTLLAASAKTYLLVRGGDAALLGLAACLLVLVRNPGPSFRSLVVGAVWGVAMVAVAVVALKVRGMMSGAPGAIRFAAAVVFGALVIAALSASVHYTIKAFQAGVRLPRRA